MTKKIWTIACILFATFLVILNYNQSLASKTSSIPIIDNSPVVIGYSSWAGWWPWAIAEQNELFAKNNIDVELRWYDSYTKSMEDLAAGEIDGNCQTLNDTISFSENAVKGEVAVLVNDNSDGNDKIIAAKEIKGIADLKGKKVAVEEGVVDDFLLTLALEQEGMRRDDVEIIGLETGAAVNAFTIEEVDAVGAFPPFWKTALEREGAKEIASSADFPGAISDLLVVTDELIDTRPEIVQGLVNTWFDTLKYMKENPEKSDRIMADIANVRLEEMREFKKGTKIFSLEDNLKAFSYGYSMDHLPFAAEKITSFLREDLKSIKKKPNIKKLFNSKFVETLEANGL